MVVLEMEVKVQWWTVHPGYRGSLGPGHHPLVHLGPESGRW